MSSSSILTLSPVWSVSALFTPPSSRWTDLLAVLPLNPDPQPCSAETFLIVPTAPPAGCSLCLLPHTCLFQTCTCFSLPRRYHRFFRPHLPSTTQEASLNAAAHSDLTILQQFILSDVTFSY